MWRKISLVPSCFDHILEVSKARSYLLFIIIRIQTGLSCKLKYSESINDLYLSNNWFKLFSLTLPNVISPCFHSNPPSHSILSFSNFVYRKVGKSSKWGIWWPDNVSKECVVEIKHLFRTCFWGYVFDKQCYFSARYFIVFWHSD